MPVALCCVCLPRCSDDGICLSCSFMFSFVFSVYFSYALRFSSFLNTVVDIAGAVRVVIYLLEKVARTISHHF